MKKINLVVVGIFGIQFFPVNAFASEAEASLPAAEIVDAELVPTALEETILEEETVPTDEQIINSENNSITSEEVIESTTALETVEISTPSSENQENAADIFQADIFQAEEDLLQSEKVEETFEETSTNQVNPKAAANNVIAINTSAPLSEDYDGALVNHPNTITDPNATITSDYNFMPNFFNLDDIIITGEYMELNTSYQFSLTKNAKNEITVTYKNVGTYNGQVVDLKLTVKDWTFWPTTSPHSSGFLTVYKTNGIIMRGVSDVLLNYSFLDNLSGRLIPISGFFNFTEIDLLQSIDIYNNNLKNFYVTPDNQLYYKLNNDFITVGEINNVSTTESDKKYWLTYTYHQISQFDIRYKQEYETNAYFSYSYKAPIVIETTNPIVKPVNPLPEETVSLTAEPAKTETVTNNQVEETKLPKEAKSFIETTTDLEITEKKLATPILPETGTEKQPFIQLAGMFLTTLSLSLFSILRKRDTTDTNEI